MGKLNLSRRTFAKLHRGHGCHGGHRMRGAGRRTGRGRRGAQPRQRDQARPHLLPRLRQDGVRRVGHGGERARRSRVEGDQSSFQSSGNSLRQGARRRMQAAYHPDRIYHPHEAHEPQGRGAGLGSASRGTRPWKPSAAKFTGDHRSVRRPVHLQHVRHVPPVGLRPLRVSTSGCSIPPTPMWLRRSARGRVASWAASPRWTALRGWRCVTARGSMCSGVPRRRTRTTTTAAATWSTSMNNADDAHLHRPASVRLWQRGRLLAEPGAAAPMVRWPCAWQHILTEARSGGLGVCQALDRMRPSSWWKTWNPRAAATIELFTRRWRVRRPIRQHPRPMWSVRS